MKQFEQTGREIRNGAAVFQTEQNREGMQLNDADYQKIEVSYYEPAPVSPSDFDIAPIDQIAQLQRDALPVLQRLHAAVQEAEGKLLSLESTSKTDTESLCRRLVESGVWHTDNKGQKLVYTIVCNGDQHMKYLTMNGDLSPTDYRMADIQRSGTSTQRIFMLHDSIKSMADLYKHPELVEQVQPVITRQQEEAERQLAEKRIELADYKATTKRRLQQLEKRFKSMLD